MRWAGISGAASPAPDVVPAARTLAPGALAAAVRLRLVPADSEICRSCGATTTLLRTKALAGERGPGTLYVDLAGHVWIIRTATGDREHLGTYRPRVDATGSRSRRRLPVAAVIRLPR